MNAKCFTKKKDVRMKKNSIITFLLLLSGTYFDVSVASTVLWQGSSTPDVVDRDLLIRGDQVFLDQVVRISAIDRDVNVILEENVQLLGGSNSTLYINAEFDRVITFELSENLILKDLTVIQHGDGRVNFVYGDGIKLVLKQGEHNKGTQWWIRMGSDISDIPTLSFSRVSNNQMEHNFVIIREKSLISFIGHPDNTTESGLIRFDPTNMDNGRFILEIHDKGAFLIEAATTAETFPYKITSADINRTTPAAGTPRFSIDNSTENESSSLLVLNYNETLFDLLADPFLNLNTRDPMTNYVGKFDGIQYGFVLGSAAQIFIRDNTYLDYVALALNQDPRVHTPGTSPDTIRSMIKQRNPSALFIDGSHNPEFADRPATIFLGHRAALEVRSGIAADDTVAPLDSDLPFTVLPEDVSEGAGNWVLDVEGPLRVHGISQDSNKIEVLSLFVQPTGGHLLTTDTGDPIFPLRTFIIDPITQELAQYNKGAIFVNNTIDLINTTLEHTDTIHNVPGSETCSEPTYVGGETFLLSPLTDEYGFGEDKEELEALQELVNDQAQRPRISFENSTFNIHTSAAATGVDFQVPNSVTGSSLSTNNVSKFVFFNNGPEVDNGTGRLLVLGTLPGSLAIDNSTVINQDSYLDVIQTSDFSISTERLHELLFRIDANTTEIVPVVGTTTNRSIQTVVLNGNSNIAIGTDANSTGFINDTFPTVTVNDNYFSFVGNGGTSRQPTMSGVTGQAGIFVDLNGWFRLSPNVITNFGVGITKSRNGQIDILKNQAFFQPLTGISTWNVNLAINNILVGPGEHLAEYTFNWINAIKNYNVFTPYEVGNVILCDCPPVTTENVTNLPTIFGTPQMATSLDQLQIQGSRIGDPAMIMFDGCLVREVIFNLGNCPSEAPVALFVLQNDARVGLGSADQNVASNNATVMLGVNGVEIIANGNGTIVVNEDILINNICSLLKGPAFRFGEKLTFYSPVPREIRVKPTAVLDLRSFDDESNIIEFSGDIRLIMEPGSTLLMDGARLQFTDNAQMIFEPSQTIFSDISSIPFGPIDNTLSPTAVVQASEPHNELAALTDFGFGLQNTNPYRVRLIGIGTIAFNGSAEAFLPNGAIVGVETLLIGDCVIDTTDIKLLIEQSAAFHIGRLNPIEGGVFQIGNVVDNGQSHNVNFTLTLDGSDAIFELGSLGLLGIGIGAVRPALVNNSVMIVPQHSLMDTLFNVQEVTFDCIRGNLDISRIYASDDPRASAVAINSDPSITYTVRYTRPEDDAQESLRLQEFATYGGGNFVKIDEGDGAIAPVVQELDGQTEQPRLEVGIFASTLLQDVQPEITGNAELFFDEMKTDDMTGNEHDNQFGRVNVGNGEESFRSEGTADRVGAVIIDTIVRDDVFDVSGPGDADSNRQEAVEDGAAFALVDQLNRQILAMGLIPID